MEIPAKNTIGFQSNWKSNFYFRYKRKTVISPTKFTLFHFLFLFLFLFFFFFIKITPKPLLWAKYHNFNKSFHLKVSAGNLNKR